MREQRHCENLAGDLFYPGGGYRYFDEAEDFSSYPAPDDIEMNANYFNKDFTTLVAAVLAADEASFSEDEDLSVLTKHSMPNSQGDSPTLSLKKKLRKQ